MPQRNVTFKTVLFFIVVALLGVTTWLVLAFPRLTILQLSLDRPEALRVASAYLQQAYGVDVTGYRHAIFFADEEETNRYLQKALGREAANKWLKDNHYEPFFWVVRFFKPGQKEEFQVDVSCRDGRILFYRRTIDGNAFRPEVTSEEARKLAERALGQLGVELSSYEPKDMTVQRHSHRVEYNFTWQRRDVNLPWSRDPKAEGAKFLTGATVSGHEILSFNRQLLLIPDGFGRFLDAEHEAGRNLSTIFYFIFLAIVIYEVLVVVNTRNHLAIAAVRPFYYALSCALFVAVSLGSLSLFENMLSSYSTSQPLGSYLWRTVMQVFLSAFFVAVGFLLVGLAAEAVRSRHEEARSKGAFLFYIRSTFFSRDILGRVLAGYATACGLLGLQAVLFAIGERHFGVWSEDSWLTQYSNAYLPAIIALAMGLKASLSEELTYRVFVLNTLRPLVKFVPVAVFLSAIVWGFGHTGYAVFPTWFRGVEVAILGVFLSWVYLRCGIIAVLVGHYLFDVFWASSGCLLGQVRPLYFYSSLGVLFLPLFWGLIAFLKNVPETERPWVIRLNPRQFFNRQVLESFVARRAGEGADLAVLQEEFLRNGWDPVVVREVFSERAGQ